VVVAGSGGIDFDRYAAFFGKPPEDAFSQRAAADVAKTDKEDASHPLRLLRFSLNVLRGGRHPFFADVFAQYPYSMVCSSSAGDDHPRGPVRLADLLEIRRGMA